MKKNFKIVDHGGIFENLVDEWAEAAGLRQIDDKTMTIVKKRSKGKFDRRYKFDGFDWCMELKSTGKDSLSFNSEWFFKDSLLTTNGLHHHQIRNLIKEMNKGNHAGVLIEYRKHEKVIYIEIQDFVIWAINNARKSIKIDEALVLGHVVSDLSFMKGE